MKILAFDSTAKVASVSVTDGKRQLGIYNIDNGLTQSELLLPMAENLLKTLKCDFSDIDAYAVTVGPGSFTGVRIGVSLVKGLAFNQDKPCIEVSTLEALAENLSPLDGIISPCMDARRGQVYNALFECRDGILTRLTPDRAISTEELAKELLGYSERDIYLSGDGYGAAYAPLSNHGIKLKDTPPLLINQNAYSVALCALRKYERGEITSDKEIRPTYLRMPQAERERLEREKAKG